MLVKTRRKQEENMITIAMTMMIIIITVVVEEERRSDDLEKQGKREKLLLTMVKNYFKVLPLPHHRHLEENMITIAMIISIKVEEKVETIEVIIEVDGVVNTVIMQSEEEKISKILPSHIFKVRCVN